MVVASAIPVPVMAAFRGRRGGPGKPKNRQSSAGGSGTGRRSPRVRKDDAGGSKLKSATRAPQRAPLRGFDRREEQGPNVDLISVKELLGSAECVAPDGVAGGSGAVFEEASEEYSDLCDPHVSGIVDGVLEKFRFDLDGFQEEAFRHLLCGRNVVVCAPTGAGKTAIAEAVATHILGQGGKVIYTTPLKALSNQKMLEMRERFGAEAAGLQTGDASINPDGSVVVMTTEILRNILYRVEEEVDLPGDGPREVEGEIEVEEDGNTGPETAVAEGQASSRLDGVRLVVLDECHYLGDPSRGSVWEESIINLPPDVLILAMSATVRNPKDVSGWISKVHGPTATVQTSFRPVPLKWHFCLSPGGGDVTMLPLLDDDMNGLNPRLLSPAARVDSLAGSLSSSSWDGASGDESDGGWGRWDQFDFKSDPKKDRNAKLQLESVTSRTLDELIEVIENTDPWHKLRRRDRVPSIEGTIAELQSRALLPAIWFIFSRKDCESAVEKVQRSGLALTTPKEREIINRMVQGLRDTQPEAVKESSVAPLIAGVAAHHAGCLPGWKLLIERLFQEGLLKVVFATETLAAGINMPARTTLLTSLSKRRDDGISLLRHNELMQMAGRAGRRGYDTQGHCVIVQSKWDEPDAAWSILRKGPESLESKFAANYGMALNLLRTRTLEEAKEFLDRSFSMYLSSSFMSKKTREIERLEAQAESVLRKAGIQTGEPSDSDANNSANAPLEAADPGELTIRMFEKLQGRRREEKRAAKLLRQQLADERGAIAETILSQKETPLPVGLDLSASSVTEGYKYYFLPALLVGCVDRDIQGNRYLCLGADNNLYIVYPPNIAAYDDRELDHDALVAASEDITARASALPAKAWSTLAKNVVRAEGSPATGALVCSFIPEATSMEVILPSNEGLRALEEQKARIQGIKAELDIIREDKKMAKLSRKRSQAFAKAGKIMDEAAALRENLEGRISGSWRDFLRLVAVLQGQRAIEDRGTHFEFSPLGLVARDLRGSNELWLAQALTHPSLQLLQPPQLAAVVASLVAEEAVSRISVVGCRYPASEEVMQVIEQLQDARRELWAAQMHEGVEFGMCLDASLSGIVEAWASGVGWEDIVRDCDLDEGDVARLLIRTVDTLRQASYCEGLSVGVGPTARRAARAMDRAPISDLVG